MKRLLLATAAVLLGIPALAADLPVKSAPLPVTAPYVYNPFYLGLFFGGAATSAQNELAIGGVSAGTPKVNPVGLDAGLVLGYGGPISGGLYLGAEGRIAYNFGGNLGIGCTGLIIPCMASAKNSLYASEMLQFGLTSAIWQNLTFVAQAGAVQRQVKLGVLDLGTFNEITTDKWLFGPGAGAQVRLSVSKQSELVADYVHAFYKGSFTPAQSVGFPTNTVSAKDEDRFTLGWYYHL